MAFTLSSASAKVIHDSFYTDQDVHYVLVIKGIGSVRHHTHWYIIEAHHEGETITFKCDVDESRKADGESYPFVIAVRADIQLTFRTAA